MIKVLFYATELDEYKSYLEYLNDALTIKDFSVVEDKIRLSTPIFNYANFFRDGIDLFDVSVELGSSDDYYGFVPDTREAIQALTISIERVGDQKPPLLQNGITIEFNKYTCKGITIYTSEEELGSRWDDNGLPEINEFVFPNYTPTWNEQGSIDITVEFFGLIDDSPFNIKGVALGKVLDLDIKSFDMIHETNPISDDLAINETNVTAVIKKEFVPQEGQKIIVYNDSEIVEEDILKSIEETEMDIYKIKARSKVDILDSKNRYYPATISSYGTGDGSINADWNNMAIFPQGMLDAERFGIPQAIEGNRLSAFLPYGTERKMLQQIAWASCCGIDTTYKKKITLVPYFARETTVPDIVIHNSDNRTLKTSIKEGEKYSSVIWEWTNYVRNNDEIVTLTEALPKRVSKGYYVSEFESNKPVNARYIEDYKDYVTLGNNVYFEQPDPYTIRVINDGILVNPVVIKGHKYNETKISIDIPTGVQSEKTLKITKQDLYPYILSLITKDDESTVSEDERFLQTEKVKQLKKWYQKNNTLSATVVDNNNEIRLGKVLKIQLKKGDYFQGIITKITRNNINDYHIVKLEAHEWN